MPRGEAPTALTPRRSALPLRAARRGILGHADTKRTSLKREKAGRAVPDCSMPKEQFLPSSEGRKESVIP